MPHIVITGLTWNVNICHVLLYTHKYNTLQAQYNSLANGHYLSEYFALHILYRPRRACMRVKQYHMNHA